MVFQKNFKGKDIPQNSFIIFTFIMADKELDWLENVMMSFAFADTEEKLQNNVTKFLPIILTLLSSSHSATKTKVITYIFVV